MARKIVISSSVGALMLFAISARADDYPGSKIVTVAKGEIVFEDKDGNSQKKPVSLSLKIFDDKGEQQDAVTGTRFLAKGNIVDVKTDYMKDPKNAKKKIEAIVEIKFVSGKVAELPKTGSNVDLKPDPNFKDKVIEFSQGDPVWQEYIKKAKVGDFAEYKSGKNPEPGRYETLEVGKDYIVVAKVDYILGKRTELRTKHMLPKAPKPGTKTFDNPFAKGGGGKKSTEELTIGDKMVKCTKTVDGKLTKWTSTEVPFDGKVKEDSPNYKYILVDFGRGEK
ncbi:MAG TPA: hypothetical protein VKS79_08350 [Gemmataceae bacterium]|nr:hypothetical protein [Gemmataceae bacterium]